MQPVPYYAQRHEPFIYLGYPGGFGADQAAGGQDYVEQRPVKQGSAEDAAFIMKNAGSVIIARYGMAVAGSTCVREMVDEPKKNGVRVSRHSSGRRRMPGHMNVLLAEIMCLMRVFELEDITSEFAQADVAFVIGANDVTNPSAKTVRLPDYGPILDVERAGTVLFIKRGMGQVMPVWRMNFSATTP